MTWRKQPGSVLWTTGYSLDITAQSTQAISSDTTYTIDGKVWTKVNSTNDNVAMALTNGTGFVIQPKNGGTDYNGATRNSPMIGLPITSAVPGFDIHNYSLRVWLYVSANNYAANYDSTLLAVDSGNTDMGYVIKHGYNTSGQGHGRYIGVAATNVNGFSNTTTNMAHNVMVLEVPKVWGNEMRTYSGTWSSGFPAFSALTAHPKIYVTGNLVDASSAADTWRIMLGAQRFNSATALSVTLAQLKVEYRKIQG